jgi:hypothetical protein
MCFFALPLMWPFALPLVDLRVTFIFSRALKARAIVRTLLTRRTVTALLAAIVCVSPPLTEREELTARENHPDEVHEEVVTPEIEKFWPRICDVLVVVIEHAGGIVED